MFDTLLCSAELPGSIMCVPSIKYSWHVTHRLPFPCSLLSRRVLFVFFFLLLSRTVLLTGSYAKYPNTYNDPSYPHRLVYACYSCTNGKYQDQNSQAECKTCPKGYYHREDGKEYDNNGNVINQIIWTAPQAMATCRVNYMCDDGNTCNNNYRNNCNGAKRCTNFLVSGASCTETM